MISLKVKEKNTGKTLKEYLNIKKRVEKPPSLDDKKMFDMSKRSKKKGKKGRKKSK